MTPLIDLLSGISRMPAESLALLVSLSAIGLAAFSIHVVSRRRDDDR